MTIETSRCYTMWQALAEEYRQAAEEYGREAEACRRTGSTESDEYKRATREERRLTELYKKLVESNADAEAVEMPQPLEHRYTYGAASQPNRLLQLFYNKRDGFCGHVFALGGEGRQWIATVMNPHIFTGPRGLPQLLSTAAFEKEDRLTLTGVTTETLSDPAGGFEKIEAVWVECDLSKKRESPSRIATPPPTVFRREGKSSPPRPLAETQYRRDLVSEFTEGMQVEIKPLLGCVDVSSSLYSDWPVVRVTFFGMNMKGSRSYLCHITQDFETPALYHGGDLGDFDCPAMLFGFRTRLHPDIMEAIKAKYSEKYGDEFFLQAAFAIEPKEKDRVVKHPPLIDTPCGETAPTILSDSLEWSQLIKGKLPFLETENFQVSLLEPTLGDYLSFSFRRESGEVPLLWITQPTPKTVLKMALDTLKKLHDSALWKEERAKYQKQIEVCETALEKEEAGSSHILGIREGLKEGIKNYKAEHEVLLPPDYLKPALQLMFQTALKGKIICKRYNNRGGFVACLPPQLGPS